MRQPTLLLTLLSLAAVSAGLGAEMHKLVPTAFQATFSAAHPVALKLRSGDKVVTSTLDDIGMNPADVQRRLLEQQKQREDALKQLQNQRK